MNSRTSVPIERQGWIDPSQKVTEMARFSIDDISEPFVFHQIIPKATENSYPEMTFSCYMKMAVENDGDPTTGRVTIGNNSTDITTDWTKIVETWLPRSSHFQIRFLREGTYDMAMAQLELGNKATDYGFSQEDYYTSSETYSQITQTGSNLNLAVKQANAPRFAEIEVEIDSVRTTVSELEDDMTEQFTEVYQTTDEIMSTVGELEEDTLVRFSQVDQTIDGIESTVGDIQTGQTIINQSVDSIESTIESLNGDINTTQQTLDGVTFYDSDTGTTLIDGSKIYTKYIRTEVLEGVREGTGVSQSAIVNHTLDNVSVSDKKLFFTDDACTDILDEFDELREAMLQESFDTCYVNEVECQAYMKISGSAHICKDIDVVIPPQIGYKPINPVGGNGRAMVKLCPTYDFTNNRVWLDHHYWETFASGDGQPIYGLTHKGVIYPNAENSNIPYRTSGIYDWVYDHKFFKEDIPVQIYDDETLYYFALGRELCAEQYTRGETNSRELPARQKQKDALRVTQCFVCNPYLMRYTDNISNKNKPIMAYDWRNLLQPNRVTKLYSLNRVCVTWSEPQDNKAFGNSSSYRHYIFQIKDVCEEKNGHRYELIPVYVTSVISGRLTKDTTKQTYADYISGGGTPVWNLMPQSLISQYWQNNTYASTSNVTIPTVMSGGCGFTSGTGYNYAEKFRFIMWWSDYESTTGQYQWCDIMNNMDFDTYFNDPNTGLDYKPNFKTQFALTTDKPTTGIWRWGSYPTSAQYEDLVVTSDVYVAPSFTGLTYNFTTHNMALPTTIRAKFNSVTTEGFTHVYKDTSTNKWVYETDFSTTPLDFSHALTITPQVSTLSVSGVFNKMQALWNAGLVRSGFIYNDSSELTYNASNSTFYSLTPTQSSPKIYKQAIDLNDFIYIDCDGIVEPNMIVTDPADCTVTIANDFEFYNAQHPNYPSSLGITGEAFGTLRLCCDEIQCMSDAPSGTLTYNPLGALGRCHYDWQSTQVSTTYNSQKIESNIYPTASSSTRFLENYPRFRCMIEANFQTYFGNSTRGCARVSLVVHGYTQGSTAWSIALIDRAVINTGELTGEGSGTAYNMENFTVLFTEQDFEEIWARYPSHYKTYVSGMYLDVHTCGMIPMTSSDWIRLDMYGKNNNSSGAQTKRLQFKIYELY